MVCEKCSGSGRIICPPIEHQLTTTVSNLTVTMCIKCNGTGHYDLEEMITVPLKYVKDDYFGGN